MDESSVEDACWICRRNRSEICEELRGVKPEDALKEMPDASWSRLYVCTGCKEIFTGLSIESLLVDEDQLEDAISDSIDRRLKNVLPAIEKALTE